tara:strand:- start:1060 stop:1350 length:291 start_codon:yes stop_codon:yes gene_type:complete
MEASELVALLRDLSLIMFSGIAVLSLVVITVIIALLYRKLAPVLDSSRITAKNAEELSSKLGEKLEKPLNGISNLAYTSGRLLSFILGISKGKGGE